MQDKSFSCYLIGDDNITLQCASIILAKKHQLLGLISQSNRIKKWCKANAIPCIKNIEEFEQHYKNQTCDYLFSIANNTILPPSILNIPRIYAINYHNSPLPRYAGLYATSWAIINDEKEHAISWHIMHEHIDAGDILKQPRFAIDEDETALSLNLKCYEQAVQAFQELVDELALNTVNRMKQDLSHRTYFGLKNKPVYYGFISWNTDSEYIDRLCRALTFGEYQNELVTPKIIVNEQVLVIKSYRKLGISSNKEPGTLVHCSTTDLQIATQTTDIILYELMNLSGEEVPIGQLIDEAGLSVGQRLIDLDEHYIQCLALHPALIEPSLEQFWIKEHLKCIHGGVSFLSNLSTKNEPHLVINPIFTPIQIGSNLLNKAQLLFKNQQVPLKNILFSLLLSYIYRLNNYKNFTVDYSPTSLRAKVGILDNVLEQHVPFTTHFDSELNIRDVVLLIEQEQERLRPFETYSKDIFIRYPQLSGLTQEIDISISFFDPSNRPDQLNHKKLNFYIAEDGSLLFLHNNTNWSSYEESYTYFTHMEQHLNTLLEDALTHPQKKLHELSLLTNSEEQTQLEVWNNTQQRYDVNRLLHEIIETQADTSPHSIAAKFLNETITYEELNQKANQLAHCLINQGIKPNDIVSIYIHRGMYMLISILGILKSGAAYLPLDPHYPDKRIKYMLDNSQSAVLLTHKNSVSRPIHGYEGFIIDVTEAIESEQFPSYNPRPLTQSSDLAYVIYTSGTTGAPKGVPISHRSACNHMEWMRSAYDFHEQDVFLQKTPFSFDASVWEFFIPLWMGATLIIAPDDAHASPKELINLVSTNQVSILQLVPSMLREMTLTPGFSSCTSLRHVFCGGEVLLPETIHAFFEHQPSQCALHNLYGPTEATIDSLTLTCTPQDAMVPVSRIGSPIANTKAYILDDHMQLVPTGIIGELYLSGDGLSKGYLHNEELTQQKFLPNPFATRATDRLYKTGDLVKWQNNGTIEYHERQDSQVKIRGFRVEISEIESCLDKIPSIYQCLVKPEATPLGEMSLSAYLILLDDEPITASEIRSLLKNELPEFMIPTRFYVVDKLLTTPSGKLDRKSPLTPLKQLYLNQEHCEPQNEIEQTLHDIWCSVLNRERLSIHDDFFELGGHSLTAMNIISRIKEHFSIKLSLRLLFDLPTIHSLAMEIELLLHSKQSDPFILSDRIIIPLKKSGTQTPLFFIHPIGGSIFWYKALAKYINKDVPLYGLQDPGLEHHEFFFKNLEEMASTYIKAIQKIQHHGPYLIGGASFGSTVAIEIARQFQEMNEPIKAIISLDGWAEYPALQRNEEHFKEFMREQNKRILEHHMKFDIKNSDTLLELQWHREKMLMHYKVPPIRSKFILFKSETLTELFNFEAPLNWWDNYTSEEIICHLVPGTHESMFSEPNLFILANKLNESLNTLDTVL
ncbi:amino acid adenylation domain-containing protein [Legionella bononiensis]|uniref:Amino acid adenylation domain-containing protein n=1 Tax=Legionella bononiensis TaxID=2793102 RepID=A0ABS1WDY0_9GAMM|nr:amino acid adenylation domain-containing protein [Legionella bononiensis]MBL7527568.1 amino acid adenylation domain-containing protein [Legionella bononiensis]